VSAAFDRITDTMTAPMGRIILLLALMLASSPAQGSTLLPGELFTPDAVSVAMTAPVFANGTNRFCWQCGDGIPSNDLQLILGGGRAFGVQGYPVFLGEASLGAIAVSGPAASFAGLNVSFSFRVTTTVTTKVNPDGSRERLPQPSVTEGVLPGAVVGDGRRDLFLHYGGRVDGVEFLESSINEITVPPEGRTKLFTSEVFVDEEIPYAPGAPVVPEPTSLLLLGSALAAAGLRARRAARSRRC
jgi:hypothetical protein